MKTTTATTTKKYRFLYYQIFTAFSAIRGRILPASEKSQIINRKTEKENTVFVCHRDYTM